MQNTQFENEAQDSITDRYSSYLGDVWSLSGKQRVDLPSIEVKLDWPVRHWTCFL